MITRLVSWLIRNSSVEAELANERMLKEWRKALADRQVKLAKRRQR